MKPQTRFPQAACNLPIGPVQGPAGRRYLNFLLSTAVADLGAVPDWKRTAFWCNDNFLQAFRMANRLPAAQQAMAEMVKQQKYASTPLSKACSRLLGVITFARQGCMLRKVFH